MYKAAIGDAVKGLRGKEIDRRSLDRLVETFVGRLLDNLDNLDDLDEGGEVEDLVEMIKGGEEWRSFSLFDQLDMMDSDAASEYIAPAKILVARESEGLERAMEMLEKMEAEDMCQTESWEGIKGIIGEALEGGGKRGVKIVMKFQKVLMPTWRGELLLMLIEKGRRVWGGAGAEGGAYAAGLIRAVWIMLCGDLVESITSITPDNLNKILI
ncbi:hypothetical protein TrRE_jg3410 [Triparma retinervis]|uniref:Uncharacterized protein n=1 Tax=Triparma retinervis TaxID=2557542 RepID=A0A9W7DR72_9STRA|nr:hypothetical protein TrRE_jg3410 [Triparma retinervis]